MASAIFDLFLFSRNHGSRHGASAPLLTMRLIKTSSLGAPDRGASRRILLKQVEPAFVAGIHVRLLGYQRRHHALTGRVRVRYQVISCRAGLVRSSQLSTHQRHRPSYQAAARVTRSSPGRPCATSPPGGELGIDPIIRLDRVAYPPASGG
jgi:hypothetical protein